MAHTSPVDTTTEQGNPGWRYVGADERGRELEIIAVEIDDEEREPFLLVLHVMPTQLRGDDPESAVWCAARRIFGYAFLIRGGILAGQAGRYLHAQEWLISAARLRRRSPGALATGLFETVLCSGAVISTATVCTRRP
jgi:hypothetical protein